MRSPTKQDGTDRRKTERRASASGAIRVGASATAASVIAREAVEVGAVTGVAGATGERRVVEQRGVVTSMVDALEDILKWERASERAMRVATEQSTTELDPSN